MGAVSLSSGHALRAEVCRVTCLENRSLNKRMMMKPVVYVVPLIVAIALLRASTVRAQERNVSPPVATPASTVHATVSPTASEALGSGLRAPVQRSRFAHDAVLYSLGATLIAGGIAAFIVSELTFRAGGLWCNYIDEPVFGDQRCPQSEEQGYEFAVEGLFIGAGIATVVAAIVGDVLHARDARGVAATDRRRVSWNVSPERGGVMGALRLSF